MVEEQAPSNYELDVTPRCTGVLGGTVQDPAPVNWITVPDVEAAVNLQAHKFNALAPATSIPDATYDLYVEGKAPPSGVPSPLPPDAVIEGGDTWYARGTTNSAGVLTFIVPAGFSWCLLEHTAPIDYSPDPALHCTAVLTASSTPTEDSLALPETLSNVILSAYKFNSTTPNTVIPGATYELVVHNPAPPSEVDRPAPPGAPVPANDSFWAEGTTDANGLLSFSVPAGSSWCLHEISSPSGYLPDPSFHCTGVLTTDSVSAAATIALPETPVPGSLAFTGGLPLWSAVGGLGGVVVGGGISFVTRTTSRRRLTKRREADD